MNPTLSKFRLEITGPGNVVNSKAIHSAAGNETIVIENRTETATTQQMNFSMLHGNNFEVSHPTREPVLTLLVMLSGEFGNNMAHIINAWGVARKAQESFGLTTRLVFHQQIGHRGRPMGKAVSSTRDVKNCIKLPIYLRTGDFTLGKRLVDEQYFQEIPGNIFRDGKFDIEILNDYLSNHPELIHDDEMSNRTIVENGSKVPRLMVRLDSGTIYSIVDTLYDDLRTTFVFDDEKCCGKTLEYPPREDESVLHLRNFATELRKESLRKRKGYEQLDKDRIATELLGHLKDGDRIALAGRSLEKDAANNSTEAYGIVRALEARNLTVRFSPGESGMEDFCFLKSAKKELIGSSVSTYAKLAAYLAGPSLKMTRLYQYVTDELERIPILERFQLEVGQETWTHPELRSRIRFEQYFPKTSNNTL